MITSKVFTALPTHPVQQVLDIINSQFNRGYVIGYNSLSNLAEIHDKNTPTGMGSRRMVFKFEEIPYNIGEMIAAQETLLVQQGALMKALEEAEKNEAAAAEKDALDFVEATKGDFVKDLALGKDREEMYDGYKPTHSMHTQKGNVDGNN